MAYFSSQRGLIPRLRQQVVINGGYDPTVWCNSVSVSCGLDAATAAFICPRLVWESSLEGIREAYVQVYVSAEGGPSINVFNGYIDNESASLTPDQNSYTFGAKSVVAYLKKVRFGRADGVPVRTYQLVDPTTGVKTGVTIKSILQKIWGNISGAYGSRVKLGNTSALGGSPNVPDPEITLRCATYESVTEQLVGYYGNVVPIQRFSGYVTYIDFVRLGDPGNPVNSVRVAYRGEKVTDGANVAKITKAIVSSDVTTMFRAYGTARRYAITLASYDMDANKKLLPNWDRTLIDGEPYLETAVLAAPNTSDHDGAGALPGADKVFREFLLPKALWPLKKLKELPVTQNSASGVPRKVSCQAFIFPSVLVDDPDDANKKIGVASTTPVPVKGVKWDLDKNLITFAQPCVRPKSQYLDETGQIVTEWEAAPIEVTIGIEDTEHWVYADADGIAAANLGYDFASDGMQDEVVMDNLPAGQMTNVGYPIGGKQWPCRIYNETTKTVAYVTSAVDTTPGVQQTLQRIAQEQLANSCRRAITLSIEIPWFAPGYVVGNRLIIEGNSSYDWDDFTVTSVGYDFSDGGQVTTLTADNTRPKRTSSLKTKAGPQAFADDSESYDDQEQQSYDDDQDEEDADVEDDGEQDDEGEGDDEY